MNKKYEVAVNLPQDFTAAEQTQGRNNIGACDTANIAPAYTKKTYAANSYVMHDGVLYTNENAIGTAEDWNQAHWTQTTVAEMMAGAGGSSGYSQIAVTASNISNVWHVPTVPNRTVVIASPSQYDNDYYPWSIELADDCTDATIIIKSRIGTYSVNPSGLTVSRGNEDLTIYNTRGQLVDGNISDDGCGYSFDGNYNGFGGRWTASYIEVQIRGNSAFLTFGENN